MPRVVELPDRGRLIVGTDLQGNIGDFERLAEVFEEAKDHPDGAVLVLTGDLVHGPEIPRQHWPDYLGSFYQADSAAVIASAKRLADDNEGRVHYLLGNHEHAHIGGPVVSKFFANEALRLERLMGDERAADMHRWLSSWPLAAFARRAQIALLHAAPNAAIRSASDLDAVELAPPGGSDGLIDELLIDMLWSRTASAARATSFLQALDPDLKVAIFGHDVAREGYAIEREPLLCISTSFGCHDGDKLYLDWDLSRPASSARHIATEGLRPLYPEALPLFRKPSSSSA